MQSECLNARALGQLHVTPELSAVAARHWFRVLVVAVLCAMPFGAAFFPVSSVAPYLGLVALVPAMCAVRHLALRRDIIVFAAFCSLVASILVTYWLPNAIRDAVGIGVASSVLVSIVLWASWCGGVFVFLLVYRFCHAVSALLVACLGVALFNQWPTIFGENPFLTLLHAPALSGGAFFLGTAPIELMAILISGYLAAALMERSIKPAVYAVLLVLALLSLDGASAWYLASAPGRGLNVALVQSDNVYSKKLSSAADLREFVQEIIAAEGGRPDLVIFPEGVFTFNRASDPESANSAIEALKQVSQRQGVAFLLSLVEPHTSHAGQAGSTTTKVSSLLITGGQEQGFADKASTIPFAEYTPAWALWPLKLLGAQTHARAPSGRYKEMSVNGVRIIPLSCFESLSQTLVETRLAARTGVLVNQSNLDSFGRQGSWPYKSALWQHMAYEQRWVNQWQVPVVRAVRSGGATAIDARGVVNLALLGQSWGREWVKARVNVRDSLPLDGGLSRLRYALSGLIGLLAVYAVWRLVAAPLLATIRGLVGRFR